MVKKGKNFLGVTLTESGLKIAQVEVSGSTPKVKNIKFYSTATLSSKDVISVIRKAFKKINIKKENILFSIPPDMVSTKNIDIPSVDNEEIKSIVDLQACRHTPLSRHEIQVGYINLGVYKESFTKVLLVIANKDQLKAKMSLFEYAGIKITDVVFAPESVANFYESSDEITTKGVDGEITGVIDIDEHTTEFVFIKNGLAVFSRSIPIGKFHISDQEDSSLNNLVEELQKTVESYQSEGIAEVPKNFFISYEDDQADILQRSLEERLKWNVGISSYFDKVKIKRKTLKKIDSTCLLVSFLDVIAVSGFAKVAQVSLMPEEVLAQKHIADQGREVLKMAMLAFVVVILLALILSVKIYFKSMFLNKIEKEYVDTKKKVVFLEKKKDQTNVLNKFFELRMVSLDVINELYNIAPQEVYLTAINFEENGNIRINGISDTAAIVFNLGTKLKESELFTNVNIKSTTSRKDHGKDVSAFEIVFKVYSILDDKVEEIVEGQ